MDIFVNYDTFLGSIKLYFNVTVFVVHNPAVERYRAISESVSQVTFLKNIDLRFWRFF